jgi:hypothetical protein
VGGPLLGFLVHQDVVRKAGAFGLARLPVGNDRFLGGFLHLSSFRSNQGNKKRIPTDAERPSESFTIRFAIRILRVSRSSGSQVTGAYNLPAAINRGSGWR